MATPGFRRPMIAMVLPQRLVSVLSGNGEIQIEVAAGGEDRGQIERCRQYAGHGDRLIVDGERAADDAGIGAEAPVPQTVAQAARPWARAICIPRR